MKGRFKQIQSEQMVVTKNTHKSTLSRVLQLNDNSIKVHQIETPKFKILVGNSHFQLSTQKKVLPEQNTQFFSFGTEAFHKSLKEKKRKSSVLTNQKTLPDKQSTPISKTMHDTPNSIQNRSFQIPNKSFHEKKNTTKQHKAVTENNNKKVQLRALQQQFEQILQQQQKQTVLSNYNRSIISTASNKSPSSQKSQMSITKKQFTTGPIKNQNKQIKNRIKSVQI